MRYVYCVTDAGFNDILTQLAAAWGYACKTNRTLVVDTSRSAFGDSLARYFASREEAILLNPTEDLIRRLNSLSAYPHFTRGKVDSFPAKYVGENVFVDPATRFAVAFDWNEDYQEDVLVRYSGGGDYYGVVFLQNLRMLPETADAVLGAINGLQKPYHAVHVRNTDYRTEYMPFFKSIFPQVAGKNLLVCSDDKECREKARRFFVESNVMTVTEIPDSGKKPLHYGSGDVREKNISMLTDLFALAGAEKLHFTKVGRGGIGGVSGFSLLALNLQQLPEVRDGVLGL